MMRLSLSVLSWLLGLLTLAHAAVGFDTQLAGFANQSGGTSVSTTMTLGASANALGVTLMCATGTFPSGVAVSYNSVAMTQIPGTQFANSAGSLSGAAYGLLAPAVSASHTLTASWTGTNECHMEAISFTGVDQTSIAVAFPNGAVNSKTTPAASPVSVTITSVTGDMIVAGLIQQASVWGAISGTSPVSDVSGPALAVAFTHAAGAATVTATGAFTGTDNWVGYGFDVRASGGGGPTPGSDSLLMSGVGAF